jgi:hypothetical protein
MMKLPVFVVLASVCLIAAAMPLALALDATYVALGPDSEPYCFYKNLGEDGTGEYALLISDPGYPGDPWADIHAARFRAAEDNIVIVPVCMGTAGRRLGAEATLTLRLETPRRNVTEEYGMCVRRAEDMIMAPAGQRPCEAFTEYQDVFSASLLESMIPAGPGEEVEFTLHVSSGFMTVISVEKDSGPPMHVNATKLYMPGDWTVGITMTAPAEEGNYNFTLRLSADGCNMASCSKDVKGVLRVSSTPQPSGFSVEISPKMQDVHGIVSATYYLTTRNSGPTQDFSVSVDVDGGLTTTFEPLTAGISKGNYKSFTITVTPKEADEKLHTIKATVEDESGMKKVADATLTAYEPFVPPGDGDDGDDGDGGTDPDTFFNWTRKNTTHGTDDDPIIDDDEPITEPVQPNQTAWIIAAVAIVCVSVAGFYLYKKSKVVRDDGSSYFEPAQEP